MKYSIVAPGWHNVNFQVCTDAVGFFEGGMTFRNPYGFIPAELYGFLPFEVPFYYFFLWSMCDIWTNLLFQQSFSCTIFILLLQKQSIDAEGLFLSHSIFPANNTFHIMLHHAILQGARMVAYFFLGIVYSYFFWKHQVGIIGWNILREDRTIRSAEL